MFRESGGNKVPASTKNSKRILVSFISSCLQLNLFFYCQAPLFSMTLNHPPYVFGCSTEDENVPDGHTVPKSFPPKSNQTTEINFDVNSDTFRAKRAKEQQEVQVCYE